MVQHLFTNMKTEIVEKMTDLVCYKHVKESVDVSSIQCNDTQYSRLLTMFHLYIKQLTFELPDAAFLWLRYVDMSPPNGWIYVMCLLFSLHVPIIWTMAIFQAAGSVTLLLMKTKIIEISLYICLLYTSRCV